MTTSSVQLRNVGIFAHVDAGKTTTTEHILFESGRIRTLGSVDSGTAQTDWLEVERERGISVRAAATTFHWRGTAVNVVDTPGHADFLSEVERCISVMDGAVLIVSAVEGVQAQTEIIWHALRTLHIPTVLYVNKMDRIGADAARVMGEIHKLLSPHAVPVQLPQGTEETFAGSMSVWTEPDDIIEKLAEADDALMQHYINGDNISPERLRREMARLSQRGITFPVLFGASAKGIGISELMDAIVEYVPPPTGSESEPLSGIVFKIMRDKTMGRMAFVRLYGGTLQNRDSVMNKSQGIEEKVTQIRKIDGRKADDVGRAGAGDIVALCGLNQTRIGDVLGDGSGIRVTPRMAVPLLTVQAKPVREAQYPALVAALQELADEDPLLDLQWLQEERELHLKVMGTIQLEILTSLLAERFGLQAQFGQPSVIYKETPSKAGEGFIAYTMPKPCWAVLRFRIEPGERGSGLRYSSQVRTQNLLASYQNEVERRVPEALLQGLMGWEVIDLSVNLVEGEHHVWHTHPLDFVVATPMGIMNGLAATGTTLLEPMLHFRIAVPEHLGGKVLSDLVQMRAEFEPPSVAGDRFTVQGTIPVATSLDYPVRLGSMSGGRGTFATRFAGYKECPPDVQATRPRRGVDPLDQAKYILSARKALGTV